MNKKLTIIVFSTLFILFITIVVFGCFFSKKEIGGGYYRELTKIYYEYTAPCGMFCLGTDRNKEYKEVQGADAATFQVLADGIAKDKKSVYAFWEEVSGIEASTFQHLSGVFWKDGSHVYQDLDKIVKVSGTNESRETFDVDTFRNLSEGFVLDKDGVFFYDDKQSYAQVSNTSSSIVRRLPTPRLYYRADIVDPETFRVYKKGRLLTK